MLPVDIWILDKVILHPVLDYIELKTHFDSGLLAQPQNWMLMDPKNHISHLDERFWLIYYFLLSCKVQKKRLSYIHDYFFLLQCDVKMIPDSAVFTLVWECSHHAFWWRHLVPGMYHQQCHEVSHWLLPY